MRYLVLAIVIIISFSCCYAAFSITEWLFFPNEINVFKYSARALLLVLSLFFFWKALLFVAYTSKSSFIKNIIASAGSLISMFIFLEIIFSFVPLSSGGGNVLVAKNWFNYYWKENQLGYRDEDPFITDNPNHENILIIGDSYVAGHGIDNEDERFSEILENELDECLDIFNVAKPGANTYDEFKFLKDFPVKPDMIIVVHVNNDIYTVADKKDIVGILNLNASNNSYASHTKRHKPSKIFIIANSFFLNFMDYLLIELKKEIQITSLAKGFNNFEDFLNSDAGGIMEMAYYKNDSLFKLHLNRIDLFIEYSKSNNIPLLFVLFPKMDNAVMDFTDQTANQPIAVYLRKKQIPVINLTQNIRKIKEEKRMSGKFDPHPGKNVHKAVARIITSYLQSSGLLKKYCE
jgi:hypothetical protein